MEVGACLRGGSRFPWVAMGLTTHEPRINALQSCRQRFRKGVFLSVLWACATGLIWALAFPLPGWAGLGWLVPAMLLLGAFGLNGGGAFRWAYVAGLVHYLVLLRWLLHIPFPAGALAGWLALSAYLALYPALWVWLMLKGLQVSRADGAMVGAMGEPATGTLGLSVGWLALREASRCLLRESWLRRSCWVLGGAALWVGLEVVRGRFLTGFPWNNLGVTQYLNGPLIQLASMTGVYGVSFLMVWMSLGILTSVLAMIEAPQERWIWRGEIALPLVALILCCVWGLRVMGRIGQQQDGRTLRVAMVQPSIPQRLIWDPLESTNRFDQLLRLTEDAARTRPDLVVWPEASVPNLFRYDLRNQEAISNLVKRAGCWMVLGADDAEPRWDTSDPDDANFYNSAFLVGPSGQWSQTYRKRRLVIFGEYVPLARWLPFLQWLTPVGEGFSAGDRPAAFEITGLDVRVAPLICFEDTFPHGVRAHVEPEMDLMLNLTNDGWFGDSSAQWQHAANATFRAVEQRRSLLRCTNNGLTCWIDWTGRIRSLFRSETGGVYGPGFLEVEVTIPSREEGWRQTLYGRWGDWFGWVCVGIGMAWCVRLGVRAGCLENRLGKWWEGSIR